MIKEELAVDTNQIDAKLCAKMFLAGAKNLEAKKEWINELNVFPVPDGDTGTNMTMTIMAAAKEVSEMEEITMQRLAKAISSGSLRGARGNSGVILSQLFRGFTKVIAEHELIDTQILAEALTKAVETAYKAVMKPKEGTILTVAKGAAEKARELSETIKDMSIFISEVLTEAEYVLSQTPEMLPVLKEAGVVDSGGQGLLEVMKGAYDAFLGKELTYRIELGKPKEQQRAVKTVQEEAEIKFGYCTEFIINLEKEYNDETEMEFKAFLNSIGDSIVLVSDDEIVKVHVHTNDPGLALQRALTYGSLSRIKIDNMREEHHEKLIKDAERLAAEQARQMPRKEAGFICVCAGEGMAEIFKSLGADYLIEGGQTMNPSTQDILEAIDHVNAHHVFIFPNNKNIILAANQAKLLTKDKDILVIPTKTVPQGITAMISYVAEKTPKENEEMMLEEIMQVKTAQITYAVRDTKIDEREIHKDDIMSLGDHCLLAVGTDLEQVALDTVKAMVEDDSELISIYYGAQTEEAQAMKFSKEIETLYPECDVEVQNGGQPIYYYVISVE